VLAVASAEPPLPLFASGGGLPSPVVVVAPVGKLATPPSVVLAVELLGSLDPVPTLPAAPLPAAALVPSRLSKVLAMVVASGGGVDAAAEASALPVPELCEVSVPTVKFMVTVFWVSSKWDGADPQPESNASQPKPKARYA
jgi:hypothetical protein